MNTHAKSSLMITLHRCLPGVVLATVASLLAVLGLMVENVGLLPTPNYSFGVTQWVICTTLIAMTSGAAYFSSHNMQKLLNQTRRESQQRQCVAELSREKEQVLRTIIDNVPALIGYWGKDLTNHFGNLAYAQWFGVDPAAMVGKHMREVVGEDQYQRNLPHVVAVLKGQTQHFELSISDPHGKHRRHTLAQYVPDMVDGDVLGFYAMVFDVSDLHQARLAAEAASVAKSQFLASRSHEIRTPMNGILGMAQLLAKPGLPGVQRQLFAQTIRNSGRTMKMLLNDMLDLSSLEAGKLTLEQIAFDIGTTVDDIQALFVEVANPKGLQLESAWQGPVGAHYVGDPLRLSQMASNLVGNAIKFTANGFVRLRVSEIERHGDQAVLEFSVEDSGIGLTAEQQVRLFQAVSQADSLPTRQLGGAGLGLSMVRSLAELMQGSVGIDSVLGKGSRFWFRARLALGGLPPSAVQNNAPEPLDLDLSDTLFLEEAKTWHILVAEDTHVSRVVIEAMLGNMANFDLRLDMVEDGQQALDFITQGGAPDLVLMDLQMPVMDGLAATAQIRIWESTHGKPHLPIIALTANAFAEDRRNCLAAGMDDFLAKPLDSYQLQTKLRRWLM
jgi:PAS domain S-box-containing protein